MKTGFKGLAPTVMGALICAVFASCTGMGPSDDPGAGTSDVATGSPDLMVASPAVSDDRPAAGAPFTLSATVRNAGAGASESTTLRYYRSTDADISSSDAEVGTEAVAELAASATSSQSVSLTAPPTAGHILLWCVRGRGGGRIRYCQQLLGSSADHGTGAGARPESGGVVSVGEQQRTGRRDDVHGVGIGEKRWGRSLGGHDDALLPVDGRDHHDIRRGGRHGRSTVACPVGNQHPFGESDGADDGWHVLLRCVRGNR